MGGDGRGRGGGDEEGVGRAWRRETGREAAKVVIYRSAHVFACDRVEERKRPHPNRRPCKTIQPPFFQTQGPLSISTPSKDPDGFFASQQPLPPVNLHHPPLPMTGGERRVGADEEGALPSPMRKLSRASPRISASRLASELVGLGWDWDWDWEAEAELIGQSAFPPSFSLRARRGRGVFAIGRRGCGWGVPVPSDIPVASNLSPPPSFIVQCRLHGCHREAVPSMSGEGGTWIDCRPNARCKESCLMREQGKG